jgi:hypothetical protein
MWPGPLVRPLCRRDASAEVDEIFFRNVYVEGADCGRGSGGLGAAFFSGRHVIPFWLGFAGGGGLKSASVL